MRIAFADHIAARRGRAVFSLVVMLLLAGFLVLDCYFAVLIYLSGSVIADDTGSPEAAALIARSGKVVSLAKRLPGNLKESELVGELYAMAGAAQCAVSEIKPAGKTFAGPLSDLQEVKFLVALSGKYSDLNGFLRLLGSFKRLTRVERFSFASSRGNNQKVSLELSLLIFPLENNPAGHTVAAVIRDPFGKAAGAAQQLLPGELLLYGIISAKDSMPFAIIGTINGSFIVREGDRLPDGTLVGCIGRGVLDYSTGGLMKKAELKK